MVTTSTARVVISMIVNSERLMRKGLLAICRPVNVDEGPGTLRSRFGCHHAVAVILNLFAGFPRTPTSTLKTAP